MNLPLMLLAAVAGGLLIHWTALIAWFVLSRWLHGRELIIATMASSTAFGVGGFRYVGPANAEALAAVFYLLSTIVFGFLIARFWLSRQSGRLERNG